ncbi:MATE family efflux transporter [Kordiimonas sediminis]|uniref:Multidrug export protein MepA n=1 Tax=Kordiimonas sediminis TaxID=1735581 RepID=A0A919ASK6_9PROT|nr:MATE family efflux transporter [Kordiimonas sediminis]GHF24158.1 MATE family efflux transporter [Kordiimonas sediminis]
MSQDTSANSFTHGRLGTIYAKTALPIIFVMAMNGFLALVDAIFLGVYVGPEALGAVTLMFPLYMVLVAIATLVSGGMSSILARMLGARDTDKALSAIAGAHGLALTLGGIIIILFVLFGHSITLLASGGTAELATMGHTYLGILVYFAPFFFVLSVNSDALRNEGRVGLMAITSLSVSLVNIGLNYLLIVWLDMGVAGSAYGTVISQSLALAALVIFRIWGNTPLKIQAFAKHSFLHGWRPIMALGTPQSLNFIGLSLTSGAIIFALQWVETPNYASTVAAYGVITRVMTFAFLPLLGLSHALQSITGNNYGAELWQRSDQSLKLGLIIAFIYCLITQGILIGLSGQLGSLFVADANVIAEVNRILPIVVALFFIGGPQLMIVSYYQAIGEAARAAILGLTKPYIFSVPLIFLLAEGLGEYGIWVAAPTAEVLLILLTLWVLSRAARQQKRHWGVFTAQTQG